MLSLIKAYKAKDPSAKNAWEILLLYPGVKAIFFHRIAHALFQWKIPFLPRLCAEFSRWLTGIEIHPGAQMGSDIVMDHGMGIVIGETAIVGDRVMIYQGVTLGGVLLHQSKRHPTIEEDVVIGAGSKILGNLTIGKGARIGANSVVLHDVPSGCSAVGIPAKVIPRGSTEFKEWQLEYHI